MYSLNQSIGDGLNLVEGEFKKNGQIGLQNLATQPKYNCKLQAFLSL